jgi:hypothetical protein
MTTPKNRCYVCNEERNDLIPVTGSTIGIRGTVCLNCLGDAIIPSSTSTTVATSGAII